MGAKLHSFKDDGVNSSCGNNVCAGAEFSICFHQNENETAHSSFCQSDMLSSREQGRRTYSVFNIHSNHWAASMFSVCFNNRTLAGVRKSHFPNNKGKLNLLALEAFMLNVFDNIRQAFLVNTLCHCRVYIFFSDYTFFINYSCNLKLKQ